MSQTTVSLRRKIGSASDLQSVVRTMKALAASSIGQYERSVRALDDYARTVELGLGACFRAIGPVGEWQRGTDRSVDRGVGVVVFGSDQGLVGRFNEAVVVHVLEWLADLPQMPQVWAVGERVHAQLAESGLAPTRLFALPGSVQAIASLVGKILIEFEAKGVAELHLCYNRPTSGALYVPCIQRLLPLDGAWRQRLAGRPWPTQHLPEVLGEEGPALGALIREHLFISLFRACAESLASENASRLAAMQRADQNIDELLEALHGDANRLRQRGIDEELFDVIAGAESMPDGAKRRLSPGAFQGR